MAYGRPLRLYATLRLCRTNPQEQEQARPPLAATRGHIRVQFAQSRSLRFIIVTTLFPGNLNSLALVRKKIRAGSVSCGCGWGKRPPLPRPAERIHFHLLIEIMCTLLHVHIHLFPLNSTLLESATLQQAIFQKINIQSHAHTSSFLSPFRCWLGKYSSIRTPSPATFFRFPEIKLCYVCRGKWWWCWEFIYIIWIFETR